MAQFFMKMAEAVMKKKLQPGMTIPGCNSFFLCKYLKDTMLQARTYLFCAIRPEVSYNGTSPPYAAPALAPPYFFYFTPFSSPRPHAPAPHR